MISIGKTRGLARLADEDGHFIMVALDQRPPLMQAIATARGVDASAVAFSDMLAAKRMLVQALACDASSMLFDPNFAMPAALDVLPARTGLIVTLEEHRFGDTPEGRRSRSIDNWSVEKIRRIGGDAVKVLAWYRPDASGEVLAHQQDYVRTIGAECRRHDISYVLELLVYPFPESAHHTTDYVESADKRADLVLDSVREFAKPEYGVDLFKLETPVPVADLPARDGSAAAQDATRPFEELGRICAEAGVPWVLLSGGAAPPDVRARAVLLLCCGRPRLPRGRTIWLDAVQSHFPDEAAVLGALDGSGREILRRLRDLTRAEARPWRPSFDMGGIDREGAFACAYA